MAGYMDGGAGITIENLDTKEYNNLRVWIRVVTGTTINATYYPMLRLASDPDSTYAPPENIRPFIGYDAVDLNHAGKNLLPNTATSQTINGVTFTVNADGSITANGTATDVVFFNVGRVLLENGISYILSGCPAGGNNGGNFLMYVSIGSEFYYDFGSSVSFEGTGETRSVFIQVKSGATVNATFHPMIRLASDPDSTYAPYQGTLHTVQIGQTVYGLRYEWLTGKGWIEWIVKNIVSAADIVSSYKNIDGTALICVIATDAIAYAADVLSDVLSSHFAAVTSNDQYLANGNSVSSSGGNVAITVKNVNAIEDMDVFLAAQKAAGTPVQIVYKLATPIEIQLTPHIISAVEPEQNNTLYGDGSIEVEYVKPLHVSIEERVAAALAAAAE